MTANLRLIQGERATPHRGQSTGDDLRTYLRRDRTDEILGAFDWWGQRYTWLSKELRAAHVRRIRRAHGWLVRRRHSSFWQAEPSDLMAYMFCLLNPGAWNRAREALICMGNYLVEAGYQPENHALAIPEASPRVTENECSTENVPQGPEFVTRGVRR
jgi:hypothetical protein